MNVRRTIAASSIAAALACGQRDAAPKTAPLALPVAPAATSSASAPPVAASTHEPIISLVINSSDPYILGAFREEDAGVPTARLREGDVTVKGGLPREVVARIVRQSLRRLRRCFEDGLRAHPRLSGTVATKLVVDADGRVTAFESDAATNVDDASVVSCVTGSFSALSFPPIGKTTTAVYPVTLEPL